MQDLSSLARDSMWPTSQEAGNMMSGRHAAMSAPGSDPVTPLPPAKDQGEPHVTYTNTSAMDPGTPPERLHGPAVKPDWSRPRHADEEPGAGTYDEPSFGRASHGLGPWRQV
jgi:hypothetical protein